MPWSEEFVAEHRAFSPARLKQGFRCDAEGIDEEIGNNGIVAILLWL